MADMVTNAGRVADAIARVAREHGAPNGASPAELALHYGGPGQLVTGRVLAQYPHALARALAAHGLRMESVDFEGRRVIRFEAIQSQGGR